jgi:hypothetical protein
MGQKNTKPYLKKVFEVPSSHFLHFGSIRSKLSDSITAERRNESVASVPHQPNNPRQGYLTKHTDDRVHAPIHHLRRQR